MKQILIIMICLFQFNLPRTDRIFVKRERTNENVFSLVIPKNSNELWCNFDATGMRPWIITRVIQEPWHSRAGLLWGTFDGINGSVEFMPSGYQIEKNGCLWEVVQRDGGSTGWTLKKSLSNVGQNSEDN